MPVIQDSIKTPRIRRSIALTLWWTWLLSSLLLIGVSGALIFQPRLAQQLWPWPLAPFNTGFFGIVYLSAAIPLISYVIRPESHRLKLILPIFTCFTTYFFLFSLIHQDSFLSRRATDIWFFLYGADSFIGLLCLWRCRAALWPSASLELKWSALYRIQAMILGGYSLANLVLPQILGQFWSWPLDVFHSHLYAGVFLSGAVAMIFLSRSSCRWSRIFFASAQSLLGLGVALSTWLLDAQMQKLDWSSLHPGLWQVIFLVFGAVGLVMIYLDLKTPFLEHQPEEKSSRQIHSEL